MAAMAFLVVQDRAKVTRVIGDRRVVLDVFGDPLAKLERRFGRRMALLDLVDDGVELDIDRTA